MLEKPKGHVLCIASVFPVREGRSGVGGMSCTPCGECQVGWGWSKAHRWLCQLFEIKEPLCGSWYAHSQTLLAGFAYADRHLWVCLQCPPPRLPPLYPTLRCAGECLTTSSWEEKRPKTVADLKLPYKVN